VLRYESAYAHVSLPWQWGAFSFRWVILCNNRLTGLRKTLAYRHEPDLYRGDSMDRKDEAAKRPKPQPGVIMRGHNSRSRRSRDAVPPRGPDPRDIQTVEDPETDGMGDRGDPS